MTSRLSSIRAPRRGVLLLLFSAELSGEGSWQQSPTWSWTRLYHTFTAALLLASIRFPRAHTLTTPSQERAQGGRPLSMWPWLGSEAPWPGPLASSLPVPHCLGSILLSAERVLRQRPWGSPGPSASSPSPGLLLAPARGRSGRGSRSSRDSLCVFLGFLCCWRICVGPGRGR